MISTIAASRSLEDLRVVYFSSSGVFRLNFSARDKEDADSDRLILRSPRGILIVCLFDLFFTH